MNEPIEANMQITKPNNSNLIQKKRPKLYCIYSSTCLEPQLEVDEDDGRGVGAEPKAELVELLGVGYVAGQPPNTSWRPAPEQELQVVIVITAQLRRLGYPPIQRRQRSRARERCKTKGETLFSSSFGSVNIVWRDSKSRIIGEPGESSCKTLGFSSACSCSDFAQGGQRQIWGRTSR